LKGDGGLDADAGERGRVAIELVVVDERQEQGEPDAIGELAVLELAGLAGEELEAWLMDVGEAQELDLRGRLVVVDQEDAVGEGVAAAEAGAHRQREPGPAERLGEHARGLGDRERRERASEPLAEAVGGERRRRIALLDPGGRAAADVLGGERGRGDGEPAEGGFRTGGSGPGLMKPGIEGIVRSVRSLRGPADPAAYLSGKATSVRRSPRRGRRRCRCRRRRSRSPRWPPAS
jgi:hypothetical protein